MALIYHPVLDVNRDVPERTVRIWKRSGWQVAKPKRSRKLVDRPAVVEFPAPSEGDPQPLNKED